MARQFHPDLNALRPSDGGKGFDWRRRLRHTKSGTTTAYFGDIATPLVTFLAHSEALVGCVAWITSPRVVEALEGKPVSFILTKDFALRTTDHSARAQRLRQTLSRLTGGLRRSDFRDSPLADLAGADEIAPIRVAGWTQRGGHGPLMHHKFVVRLRHGRPTAVFTGSYNFTTGGELNIENAIEIHDSTIARAYFDEWARVAAVSEPQEFSSGSAEPAWPQALSRNVTRRPTSSGGPRRQSAAPRRRRAVGRAKPGTGRRAA